MGALLADEPLPVIEGIALVAVSIGLILASAARLRSRRQISRVVQVYWHDMSQAGYVWAGATMIILFGALGNVEGLRVPIWLVLAMLTGFACVVIARRRWVRLALGSSRPPLDDPSRPERPRLASTSWEIGLLGAFAGGLLTYGASVSHAWGHPIHWLVAGIGLAIGYAVGLVLATPRYAVRKRRA